MKKNYILAILLFFCINSRGQNIFYDALFLFEERKPNLGNRIVLTPAARQLLSFYYPGVPADDIDVALLNSNPFFKGHFATGGTLSLRPFSSFSISSIGGANVTNFADGLAKFLVKRFKEELSITFFQKFKDALNDPKFEEFRILFPQTVSVLRIIDKEIYNFSKYLNSLREAFIKDLGNLYVGIKKVKDLSKYEGFFVDHPEINTVVVNAFYFIDQFSSGTHPGDVVANYNEETLLKFNNPHLQTNTRNAVKTLKLFSSSLKSVSPGRYWVQADSVLLMLADTLFRDMYFGLIYQKSADINFQTNAGLVTFQDLLKKAKTGETIFRKYQAHVEKIVAHCQEVDDYLAAIREKKKTEIDFNDYYNLFNASLDVVNEGLLIVELSPLEINPAVLGDIKAQVDHLIGLARLASDLYTDIRTRNYSSAVINAIMILDSIFGSRFDNELRENLLKYGTFIATVAAAENSDEVEAAIEAIALPVGSSRIKRESLRNISLNAYVGGFAGNEYMPVLNENQNRFVFGLSAPVGVAFSFGNFGRGKVGKNGGKSASIFISLIDVGALATFRMNDENSKVASEIELKNIVAPGVFFYYGFGRCPISLGAGVQLGPQLREVTTTNVNIENNYYVRYGITLAVDIPLLNFYTKSN